VAGRDRTKGNVGKGRVAIVAVESFVVFGKSGDEEVQLAIAIVVAEGDAHGGLRAPFFAEGETGGVADILEGSVPPLR